MAFIATAAIVGGSIAAAGGLAKLGMGLAGRKGRIREQRKAKEELKKRRRAYEALDTSNLAADVQNQFTNLENTYEDLTVNQQQAEFEAQQTQQQQANIMQSMQGAAGGSGIAALAQAMAQQGQLATQRASASIGAQEAQNQKLRAGEASRLQLLEREGEAKAEAMRLSGAEQSRSLQAAKTESLLGMSQQRLGAANQARAEAKAQQMSAIGDIAGAGSMLASAGPIPGKKVTTPSASPSASSPQASVDYQGMATDYNIDYAYKRDQPISVSSPNPPELTSIPNIGSTASSYGFSAFPKKRKKK